MKKLLSVIIALTLMLVCALPAFAETGKAYVTIIDDKGNLAVCHYEFELADADKDGSITISDALYATHKDNNNINGYAAEKTEYGLSLTKLWGIENGGSYGYLVNNLSAMSLADEIKDGDIIVAYCYQDLETWSDQYSYFDKVTVNATAGESFALKLAKQGYDQNWQTVESVVENADIYVDGVKTEIKTNENGVVDIVLNKNGKHIVTAKKQGTVLVTPYSVVTVTGGADDIKDDTKDTENHETKGNENPETGDNGITLWAVLFILSAFALLVSAKKNEKDF